jgi:uncharacterized repeat protein (TIGR03843 family)
VDKHLVITEGELVVEGRFVDASNATLFAIAKLGNDEVKVIYKPIAGERPLWDFPDGNLAQRERAAYVISEALGLHIVPFTILRDGPFGPGSVQEWIEMDEEFDVVAFASAQTPQLRKMVLLDAIINNTDRKYGHILVDAAGSIYGCDHGVTFHADPKLRTVLWQWAGEELSVGEIAVLNESLVMAETILGELITVDEITALKERASQMIDSGTFPYPSDEWPSIPWPPF